MTCKPWTPEGARAARSRCCPQGTDRGPRVREGCMWRSYLWRYQLMPCCPDYTVHSVEIPG